VLYASPIYRAVAATAFGWSHEATAGAFALGFLGGIPGPLLAGWAVDGWGAPRVLAASLILAACGLLGAAASQTLWQWYATAGILLGIGCSAVFAAASLIAATARQRGRALGLTFGATGFGLILGPPCLQILMEGYAWQAVMASAGVGLLLLAILVLGVAQPPAPTSHAPTVSQGQSLRSLGLARLVRLTGFFVGYVLVACYDEGVYQHAYAYGKFLGLSGVQAASILSVTSGTYTLGGIGGGLLSDVLGRRPVLIGAALVSALTLLGFAHSTAETVWLWAAAFGLTLGASVAVRAAAFADVFAGPCLGRAMGIVVAGYWVGAAIATYGGAAWLDSGVSFRALYLTAALAAVLWTLLSTLLTQSQAASAVSAERPVSASAAGGDSVRGNAREVP